MSNDLEPTPRSPETPPDLDALRRHWVRPDVAARALGLDEGTVQAWRGQKKIKSTRMPQGFLVWFDDLEALLKRLPQPKSRWDQEDLITKQAGQVMGAITRLLNLLTDTGQADLFHQIPVYRGRVDSIDIGLWHLATKAEAFRKQLNGMFYEQGYRINIESPKEDEDKDEDEREAQHQEVGAQHSGEEVHPHPQGED